LNDIDRPLKDRGKNDSREMSKRMTNKKIIPELIISSPAERALQTAVLFAKYLGIKEESIKVDDRLYLADPIDIVKVISSAPNEINSLAIFGHNPGITDLANSIGNISIDNVPTCGLLVFDFSVDHWNEINFRNLSSQYFDYPSNQDSI
jgi:phosphohistidine phosphatase